MIVYFSGTGNSRYCAQMIADKLGDEPVNCGEYIKNGIAADLISDRWVFVSPTYSWQIPHIFRDFIRSASFSGGKDAWFVMTCGGDIGNAGEHLRSLCSEKGLNYKGVLQVVMPENYVAMFSVPGEEESAKIVKDAAPCLEAGIDRIGKGEDFPDWKHGFIDKLKSGPVNTGFNKYWVKAEKFHVSDSCIGCGKCAGLCVLNNISIKDGKPVWGQNCTHCMACICNCPVGAIEYGKASVGKPRYKCIEYK